MSTVARRARDKNAKRRAILQAAIRCFGKRGYDATSLDDIGRQAEVAKGTLYLYFRSKADLFTSLLLEHGFDTFSEALDESLKPARDARGALRAFARCFRDLCLCGKKEIFELFLQLDRGDISRDLSDELRAEARQRLEDILGRVARVIDEGRAAKEIAGPEGRRLALVLWALCAGVAHVSKMGLDADEVLEDAMSCLLRGIAHG